MNLRLLLLPSLFLAVLTSLIAEPHSPFPDYPDRESLDNF